LITVHILEDFTNDRGLDTIESLILKGWRSIEVDVMADTNDDLILSLNENQSLEDEKTISLKELFKRIDKLKADVQIILNFKEPNLESRAHFLVEEWDLKEQVKYSGVMMPGHLSAWTRLNVIYNVENCLPNIYQLSQLKKAHLDVINYFCKKFQIKMIRIRAFLLTSEVIEWCNELGLRLSVSGVDNLTEANKLEAAGVDQISLASVNNLMKVN